MLGWLFLAFTLGPLVELYLLLELGERIGAGPTIALVLVTGAVGAVLARTQGFRVMRQLQEASAAGRMPAQELLEAALVLVGGVLLVTPGVLTDAFGLATMIPPARRVLARWLGRWLGRRVQVHTFGGGSEQERTRAADRTVEAELGEEDASRDDEGGR